MKITFSNIILISALFQACNSNSTTNESTLTSQGTVSSESFTNSLEKEKYLNFLAAVENSSTFSYFTVITVKDLNTAVVKEICVKGNFLSGAVHTELGIGYDKQVQK